MYTLTATASLAVHNQLELFLSAPQLQAPPSVSAHAGVPWLGAAAAGQAGPGRAGVSLLLSTQLISCMQFTRVIQRDHGQELYCKPGSGSRRDNMPIILISDVVQ